MKWIVSTLVLLTATSVALLLAYPMVPSSTLPKPKVVYSIYDGYRSAEECLAEKWEAGVSMENCARYGLPLIPRHGFVYPLRSALCTSLLVCAGQ
jgi:hypothetical protein